MCYNVCQYMIYRDPIEHRFQCNMTEQGLVRKKHVRGGHRVSTTRIIAQAVQILKSEELNTR